jgi:lipid II isoglutaminyl synthase (glutamine-hydrolysing)
MTALEAKVAVARTLGAAVRVSGRGGGTSLPGKLLIRLEPHAIGRLAARLRKGSVVISATNGKTTTAAMAASILDGAGFSLVHNRAGANMAGGIASTLLSSATRGGGIDGQLGLFEVDEFWLPAVAAELRPRVLLLGNLFRDQLDRYGELDTIAERWSDVIAAIGADATLMLNADDPLIADLGRDAPNVTYFGIEDPGVALAQMQHASDSKHCRRCGAPYQYELVYLGHLGRYSCPSCGRVRPEPAVSATAIELHGTSASSFTLTTPAGDRRVTLPVPGLYNVYNALGAAALGLALGVSLDLLVAGLESMAPAFGRAENVDLDGIELRLLLIKNPAGGNEILRTLALEEEDIDLLAILNDRAADGRDVSWIWDADFELIAPRVRSLTCSGTRAAELALRFKYAGVRTDQIRLVEDLPAALDAAVEGAAGERLFAIPTYTALLALRDELSRRGHVSQYWANTG